MKSPVEHMFGSHNWCDREWCWANDVQETKLDIARLITSHTNSIHDSNCGENVSLWF